MSGCEPSSAWQRFTTGRRAEIGKFSQDACCFNREVLINAYSLFLFCLVPDKIFLVTRPNGEVAQCKLSGKFIVPNPIMVHKLCIVIGSV